MRLIGFDMSGTTSKEREMRMMLVAGAIAVALAGCSNTGEGYSTPVGSTAAPTTSCNGLASPGNIGALAGAAGGALLGNQFGAGTGKGLATGAGALAGGAGGYMAGNSVGGC
ncbi:MAG: hypothetical protein JO010_11915 [Alphaproteobacteria bacterium]|nr:hypothetical protein [Alphaproteobacteria bacterium]